MKTAVEWFSNQAYELFEQYSEGKFDRITLNKLMLEANVKAKEMEKEQIEMAFTKGDIFGADYFDGVNITAENYYNQTFKIEQDGKWK